MTREVLSGFGFKWEAPSEEAIERAIALAPKDRFRTASVFTGRLGFVRGTPTETFQLAFESGDVKARLLYEPSGSTWKVIGRVEGHDGAAETDRGPVSLDETGKFSFEANSLEETAVYLVGEQETVMLPSVQDALGNDSH